MMVSVVGSFVMFLLVLLLLFALGGRQNLLPICVGNEARRRL